MPLRLRRGTDAERQAFTPAEAELVYTTDSKEIWVGDGSTLGGTRVTASNTGSFEGSFTGNVTGDLVGSVFADDSSLVIDGITGNINTPLIETTTINSANLRIQQPTLSEPAKIDLVLESTSDESSNTDDRGKIYFSRDDINGRVVETLVGGGRGGFYVIVDDGTNTLPISNIMYLDNGGNFCLGNISPQEKMTISGGIVASGNIKGASLSGTLTLDDSSTIIDGISGDITAPGYVQFGSFTTTERNSLSASNGMVIYNNTVNRFQGYQNNTWINLDDGTAG